MGQVIGALNLAASSNAVVNMFMGAAFCALAARSWAQDHTVPRGGEGGAAQNKQADEEHDLGMEADALRGGES